MKELKGEYEALLSYRDFLKDFRRDAVKKFKDMAHKLENAAWDDEVFRDLVNCVNEAGDEIAKALSLFSEDGGVPFLDELLRRLERYGETAQRYPV